ncbi:hypothetical protein SESBI_42222 [Sesbania bispinosa]|nr:hypothetical protein SESBI_42222 [Sesbania bispinosa]
MMHGGGNTPFTVICSDGDREINLGTIMVDPSMNFRSFITLLSQRVGIPPHHLSVFLTAAAAASASGGVDATAGVTMMAPPQQHPPIPDGIDYQRSVMNFLSSHHG